MGQRIDRNSAATSTNHHHHNHHHQSGNNSSTSSNASNNHTTNGGSGQNGGKLVTNDGRRRHRSSRTNHASTSLTNANDLISQRDFNNDAFLRFLQNRTNSNHQQQPPHLDNEFRLLSLNSHQNFNESDLSSDDEEQNHSSYALPLFLGLRDVKCLVCKKLIPADDVEAHIIMCLTKPKITYNEDVLTEEKGECIICFEVLEKDETIARLPCLCIYHKHCIDGWLKINQSCPAHPPD